MASEVDVVIVGAGAAGLAAADHLRRAGLDALVLEAKDRVGGRAWTDSQRLGVPFDYGCHWLHSASLNPWVAIARRLGFTVAPRYVPRQTWLGTRWASPDELAERALYYERSFAAIEAAGRAGLDLAASHLIDETSPWAPLLRQWMAALSSVDAEELSTLDHYNYRDTAENWPVKEGYGALVARFGEGLAVRLATPVTRIDWHRPRPAVMTEAGTIRAGAVIVTASTGVLAAETIRFDPPLPDWKLTAIEALPLGRANKIGIAFTKDVFDGADTGGMNLLAGAPRGMTYQIRPFGWNMASGYVGGAFCGELERAGEAAMVEHALAALQSVYGGDIRRHVGASLVSSWESDPWIRGAYSSAKPGQAHRRVDLARPIDGRLFFAGEAASPDFFSTGHGAYLSGVAAAEAALASLSRLNAAVASREHLA
ncbi:MAG: FAD-dependent oxidoreductase [Alphaproteobacteria bacterium]|nr:FAD-dependent oxidoreductase [Alphaproteobacteria bacterium]